MKNVSRKTVLGLQLFPMILAEARAPEQRALGMGE